MLKSVGAIDHDDAIPLWNKLLDDSVLSREGVDDPCQPIPDPVVSTVYPATHLTHKTMETSAVQHPSTLGLGLHIPVPAPLRLPWGLLCQVGWVRDAKPEPRGHRKVDCLASGGSLLAVGAERRLPLHQLT